MIPTSFSIAPRKSLQAMKTLLALVPALLGPTAHGESGDWGARIELISENSVVAAGVPFEVGVAISHREGFHSYWKNPGVVGFATRVEWKLPEGFKASPLVWPTPELVDMAGHTTHGYERDVLLTATITPSAEFPGKEVTLRARIAWMACAEACHPGNEFFSLTLPVGTKPIIDPGTAPRFRQTRQARPAPLEGWSAELLSEVDASGIVLRLVPRGQRAPRLKNPYFFSEDGQVADGRPVITTGDDGAMLFTFNRAEHGPRNAIGLPGLIAYGPPGDRRFGSIAP